MKITMPVLNVVHESSSIMSGCTLYLATKKVTNETVTLMRVYNEVIVFQNGVSTTYVSPNGRGEFDSGWIDRNYTIIREYSEGDVLTIKV